MTDPYVMPEDEFEQIEDAVQQTPRGRAFLRNYAARNRTVAVDELKATISSIKDVADDGNADSAHLDILRRELQEMGSAILHCRQEIASIKPQDGGDNRIMAATEELDAIVTSTERATTDILSAAEVIQDTADKLAEAGASSDLCDQIQNQTINIMTACSFQDITGQRTTKVVNALRYLEQRVNSMIEIWDPSAKKEQDGPTPPPADLEDKRPDAHLLNGPQLEGEGVSQDDVDELFSNTAEMMDGEAAAEETPDAETAADEASPGSEPEAEIAATEDDAAPAEAEAAPETPEEAAAEDDPAPAEAATETPEAAAAEGDTAQAEVEAAPEPEATAADAAPEQPADEIEAAVNGAINETDLADAPDCSDGSPEDEPLNPTTENLAAAEQPLGEDEVAKLLGA